MADLILRLVTRGALGLALAVLAGTTFASGAVAATDGAYQDVYSINGCTSENGIFSPSSYDDMATEPNCPSELDIDSFGAARQGDYGQWSTITPSPAIRIVGVTSTGVADCNLHSDGFSAFHFWGDNGTNFGVPQVTIDCNGATHQNGYAGSLSQHIQSSRYFGWQAQCNQSACTPTGAGIIVFSVIAIKLEAQETSGPTLAAQPANNLWYQSGWVRGAFPADLVATDPSGVCAIHTTVNGHPLSSYTDSSPDTSQWMQCPNQEIDGSVDTTSYPNGAGAVTLIYSAANAAGALSTVSKAFNVDNVTPSVSLSAPADTASSSGDQTVTAVASGGPSGISAIFCSVDGASTQTYDGATAQVPVAGIGSHEVSCYARNNAVNASGVTAISPTTTLDLSTAADRADRRSGLYQAAQYRVRNGRSSPR